LVEDIKLDTVLYIILILILVKISIMNADPFNLGNDISEVRNRFNYNIQMLKNKAYVGLVGAPDHFSPI